MDNHDFYTFSEYMKKDDNSLTASMEDYLEMIYRLSADTGFTRIHELSDALNVQPPSATKMVQRLSDLNYIKYERYGFIMLKEEGRILGETLLKRHNVIEEFFRTLGISEDVVLKETEKVEHMLSKETVQCLKDYIAFIKENPDIDSKFQKYKDSTK